MRSTSFLADSCSATFQKEFFVLSDHVGSEVCPCIEFSWIFGSPAFKGLHVEASFACLDDCKLNQIGLAHFLIAIGVGGEKLLYFFNLAEHHFNGESAVHGFMEME